MKIIVFGREEKDCSPSTMKVNFKVELVDSFLQLGKKHGGAGAGIGFRFYSSHIPGLTANSIFISKYYLNISRFVLNRRYDIYFVPQRHMILTRNELKINILPTNNNIIYLVDSTGFCITANANQNEKNKYLIIANNNDIIHIIKENNPKNIKVGIFLNRNSCIEKEFQMAIKNGILKDTLDITILIALHPSSLKEDNTTEIGWQYKYTIQYSFSLKHFFEMLDLLNKVPLKIMTFCCSGLFFQPLIFNLVPGSEIITISDFESNVSLSTMFFASINITSYRDILIQYINVYTLRFNRPFIVIAKKNLDNKIKLSLPNFKNWEDYNYIQTWFPCYYLLNKEKYEQIKQNPLFIKYLENYYQLRLDLKDSDLTIFKKVFNLYTKKVQNFYMEFNNDYQSMIKMYNENFPAEIFEEEKQKFHNNMLNFIEICNVPIFQCEYSNMNKFSQHPKNKSALKILNKFNELIEQEPLKSFFVNEHKIKIIEREINNL